MHYHYQMGPKYCLSALVYLKIYSLRAVMNTPPRILRKDLLRLRIHTLNSLLAVIMLTCTSPVVSASFNNGEFKCKYHQCVHNTGIEHQSLPYSSNSTSHTNQAYTYKSCH